MAFISRMVRYEDYDDEVLNVSQNYRTLLINQNYLNGLFDERVGVKEEGL